VSAVALRSLPEYLGVKMKKMYQVPLDLLAVLVAPQEHLPLGLRPPVDRE
jgi:hypothetical protein